VVLLAVELGGTSPLAAQGELDRLESGIRAANGPAVRTAAAIPRVYLGARADNDVNGVRVLSVAGGGPADRAGLQARDLVVGAAGRKIRSIEELSTVLGGFRPGDRLAIELLRGNQPLKVDIILAAAPGAAQAGTTLPPVPGMGRTEAIPPPPGEAPLLPSPGDAPLALPSDGPAFGPPGMQPVAPNSAQAQIEDLRRRVDQLERRVLELERALKDAQKK
jgi:hypothetical protein